MHDHSRPGASGHYETDSDPQVNPQQERHLNDVKGILLLRGLPTTVGRPEREANPAGRTHCSHGGERPQHAIEPELVLLQVLSQKQLVDPRWAKT